jgi:DNA-binding transcriptional MerR regulator
MASAHLRWTCAEYVDSQRVLYRPIVANLEPEYSLNLDTVVIRLRRMEALTINEAAQTTGWSARMLRYVERTGLVTPSRSASGYRLYGAAELQRLRTLKELLARFDVGLSDVAFAARMATDAGLREAVQTWLEAVPHRPDDVSAADWLRFEQDKHEKLLAPA